VKQVRTDVIESIGIDEAGALWVKPATASFPLIYCEAMEVTWDDNRDCLCSPAPREWSYPRWFQQIREAARRQGIELTVTPITSWSNVDADLRTVISAS
jgi:hypothetical protein